jgi:hypothetical protein
MAHECSHLTRGDLWTWRLTRLAQLTLWFQPAYWWLRHQVRLCQDYLADANAVETGSEADFADFLVQCAGNKFSTPLTAALPLSSRPSDMTRRVTMLLTTSAPLERRCSVRFHATAIGFVGLALTAAAFVRLEAQDSVPPKQSATGSPASPNPPKGVEKGKANTSALTNDRKSAARTYKCRAVTHGTMAPIEKATIQVKRSLYGDPRFPNGHDIETTTHTSDEDGFYRVVIPAEQMRERYLYIELDVEHPRHMSKGGFGYAMGMIRKNERLGGRPFFETTRLHSAQQVTGRLVTPNGKSAANVDISGYQYAGERPWSRATGHTGSFFEARTDSDGRISLPIVTDGRAAFWFQPEDAVPLGIVVPEERGALGEFKLTDGFPMKGRVLDADNKPIVGVEVSAARQSPESPEIDWFNQTSMASGGYSRSGITDDQGEFELAPVTDGEYEFRIRKYAERRRDGEYSGVFVHHRIQVTKADAPLEFRALPTVKLTVRNLNSDGEPRRGYEFNTFGRITDGVGWFSCRSSRPADGVCVAEIPRGLTEVELSFMANEHGSFRIRRRPDAPLESTNEIKLGVVSGDISGIEVLRYKAPILLIKAVDMDGKLLDDITVTARRILVGGNKTDSASERDEVDFEKQEDGRWRSSQLLPDDKLTVTVTKAGRSAESQTISLPEGKTQELVFKLLPE